MRWGDIKLRSKFGIIFGFLILAMLAVGIGSVRGIADIIHNADEVITSRNLQANIKRKEVDHLSWGMNVTSAFIDEHVDHISAQTDYTECAFGRWLHSPERDEAGRLVPELIPLIKSIEKPHKELHQSVIAINKVFNRIDPLLSARIIGLQRDHLAWANKILMAFVLNADELSVELDPTQCKMGRFLASKEADEIAASDAMLGRLLAQIQGPHQRLHESAKEIVEQWNVGQSDAADARSRALRVFQMETAPALTEVQSNLSAIVARADDLTQQMTKARELYLAQTAPALQQVRSILERITKTVDENLITSDVMLNAANSTRYGVILACIFAALASVILAVLITRSFVNLLGKGVDVATTIAQGDLSQGVERATDSRDEIKMLLSAIESMRLSLRGLISNIQDSSQIVLSVSEQTGAVSQETVERLNVMVARSDTAGQAVTDAQICIDSVTDSVEKINTSSEAIAESSKEISERFNSIAAGVEESSSVVSKISDSSRSTSQSVDDIATSVGDISVSLDEVASDTSNAADMANAASAMSKQALGSVKSLSDSAAAIGQIVETISGIAAQTNLLALNAEIQAARAGSSGREFAVVANEVKDLAGRTAIATEDIQSQIAAIQTKTSSAAQEIDRITEAIGDLDNVFSRIATTVSKQSHASSDIAQNVVTVARGVSDVSHNIGEAAIGVNEIANNVTGGVSDVAVISDSLSQLRLSIEEVLQNARKSSSLMSNIVSEFEAVTTTSKKGIETAKTGLDLSAKMSNVSREQGDFVSSFHLGEEQTKASYHGSYES